MRYIINPHLTLKKKHCLYCGSKSLEFVGYWEDENGTEMLTLFCEECEREEDLIVEYEDEEE